MLALDLLGHGGNAPAAERDHPERPRRRRRRGLAAGRRAHLVGFSLGALVAQHLARYRPDLVASLTSVSSVCRRTESRARRCARPAGGRGGRLPRRVSRPRCSAGTTEPASIRSWWSQTRTTLLANDLASFLNCYRVFATADAEIGPGAAADRRARRWPITGELDAGLHARHVPAPRRGDPVLPRRGRPRRPPHAPGPRPHEFVTSTDHLHPGERPCRSSHPNRYDHHIGGRAGRRRPTARPSPAPTRPPGRALYAAARGNAATWTGRCDAAREAFDDPRWQDLSQTRRGHLLRRLGDLIAEHADELARMETLDNGKLLREMRAQMAGCPSTTTTTPGSPTRSRATSSRPRTGESSTTPRASRSVSSARSRPGTRR